MTGGKPWTKRAFSERRILSIGLIYLGVRDLLGSEDMRMKVLIRSIVVVFGSCRDR